MDEDLVQNMVNGIAVPEGNQIQEKQENIATIGKEDITKATERLQQFKEKKQELEARILANEKWWKMQHWEDIKMQNESSDDIAPTSAWLFNSITNKHADAMDNYPEPNILPRAVDDEETAKSLSDIVPLVLEQNGYEQTYSDTWWYKLKQGTGVKGVFWNSNKLNGLGDIDIKKIDLLNLFWEPGISNIQESSDVFNLELVRNDKLKDMYPDKDLNLGSGGIELAKYRNGENVDTSEYSIVIDWYYKKTQEKKEMLHYVKYVNDTILYASENDPIYAERGFYDHGKYPFVFDTLFPEEDSPCGFGFIDAMKPCQKYIDKLNKAIMDNALVCSKKRYFAKDGSGMNEDEFNDTSKSIIHITGRPEDCLEEIKYTPLDSIYVNILNNKIEELKETSGNRDFSQGATSSGVTAASAISALMEAGSKMSRDQNKSAYRSLVEETWIVIELIRQFYDATRMFRITGPDNKTQYIQFDNGGMKLQKQESTLGQDMGYRKPVFDIKISASKKSTYSRMSQNELALQLYGNGFFSPQNSDQALACIDMMDFDGKEKIVEKIQQNGGMYQMLQQLTQQLAMITGAGAQNQIAGAQQTSQNMAAGQETTKSKAEKTRDMASEAAAPK